MIDEQEASQLIHSARTQRSGAARRGQQRSVRVGFSIIVLWACAVLATGQTDRVLDNLAAAFTMMFGSFVAGSTPQGGGAVAFPVFTKLLGVSEADARTFSLSIQAIGMGSAALIIVLTGRKVDHAALRLTVPASIGGFLAGSLLFTTFVPPAAYLKVAFTLVVVAAGAATWRSRRASVVEQRSAANLNTRVVRHAIILTSILGGAASALFGSGADVAVYLLLTIVLGVRPSIGVATSVVTMASVSIVGFALALITGQLTPGVGDVHGTDVFGMWLAAVPVVVAGAPLGSWFASRATTDTLSSFIAGLAIIELTSTAVFLEPLRTDPTLAAFAVVGLAGTVMGVSKMMVLRERLACAESPTLRTLRRGDLEMRSLVE